MQAIVVKRHGGPEVLEATEVPIPEPGPGEARVKLAAAGVNFIEIYLRTGAYASTPPYIPGTEGAGIVDKLGPGVKGVQAGDRVASTSFRGSYGEFSIAAADRLVEVPKDVPLETAAGALLQGMTAHYLVALTFPLQRGQTCLIHAAAGGVGQILVRFAKRIGARVIATVSTEEKAAIAKDAGADDVILYGADDFSVEVKRLTGGEGVHVVYDGVGRDTYQRSLACLRTRGMLALFGAASGPVATIDVPVIAKNSLFFSRPTLMNYVAKREELESRASAVFGAIQEGWLPLQIDRRFALPQAPEAHRYLGERKTKGKLLLVPSGKAKA